MGRMFRLLRADEIEVRVGRLNKNKTKASLLLYKDARCDMRILDEAVGPLNWQKRYTRDNANCIVSIYDSAKGQWIEKEDTGTESKTEAEKGLASDSAKRACVCWGIGRELYTAPSIWVPYDENKFSSYSVELIGYDENDRICELVIAENGKKVFEYHDKPGKAAEEKPAERNDGTQDDLQATGREPIGDKAAKALQAVLDAKEIPVEVVLKKCNKEDLAQITAYQKTIVLNHLDDFVRLGKEWKEQAG